MFYVCRVRHILNGSKANPQNPVFFANYRTRAKPIAPGPGTAFDQNRQPATAHTRQRVFYRFFLFAIDNGIIAFKP